MTIEIDVDKLNEIHACLDKMYCLLGFDVRISPEPYIAMTKEELAFAAGITKRTLYAWMRTDKVRAMLDELGVKRTAKLLPPSVVAYICEQYGISIKKH